MPTYEYECDGCGHRLEAFQSFSERPLRKCPECGRRKLTRLIGAGGGLIFKGTGFYITDYRDPSYHDAAKADRGPEPAKASAASDGKAAETAGGKASEKAGEKTSATAAPATDPGPTSTKADPSRGAQSPATGPRKK